MYIYIYIYVYAYTYIYIHIFIYTHMSLYLRFVLVVCMEREQDIAKYKRGKCGSETSRRDQSKSGV